MRGGGRAKLTAKRVFAILGRAVAGGAFGVLLGGFAYALLTQGRHPSPLWSLHAWIQFLTHMPNKAATTLFSVAGGVVGFFFTVYPAFSSKADKGREELTGHVDTVGDKVDENHGKAMEQMATNQAEIRELFAQLNATGSAATLAEIRQRLRPSIPEIDRIPDERLPATIQRLLDDLAQATTSPADPDGPANQILNDVRDRIEALQFGDAAKILDDALARVESEAADRARAYAALLAERGRVARLQLRYRDAATYFAKAAQTMAADPDQAADYRREQALSLYAQGDEFGDNDALVDAIKIYRSLLEMTPRDHAPLNWASIQNELGAGLSILGTREGGMARLLESVEAFRAALQERTRDLAPLQWAATQNNLGNTLATLGQRESDTTRLKEAVDAYRAALHEYTHGQAPLQWATIQNNLGNALRILGERENRASQLEEAITAYRAALEERSRDRDLLQWATIQANLAAALAIVGAREANTTRLTEAVDAFCAALEELTHERVPLQWAVTQANLGNALAALGGLENSATRLEEAVDAYRAALQERTRERVPLDWAITSANLGIVLSWLGKHRSDQVLIQEGINTIAAAVNALRNGGHAHAAAFFDNALQQALARLRTLRPG